MSRLFFAVVARRLSLLGIVVVLAGCQAIPLSTGTESTPAGQALFIAAASAHGRDRFERLVDISVRYDSHWYRLVKRLQPVLVDAGYRGGSEERILPRESLIAQIHTGESGQKYVLRSRGPAGRMVKVSYDGQPSSNDEVRDAASLVADAYRVFLLGPLAFLDGRQVFEDIGPTTLAGRLTDRLLIRARPGLGVSTEDRFILYLDREDRLMRRVRFSLEGLASTQGAIVEVDTTDHIERAGIMWPTRFHERIRQPIPLLPAHRWSLIGLDLDRGFGPADINQGAFTANAAAPARALEP